MGTINSERSRVFQLHLLDLFPRRCFHSCSCVIVPRKESRIPNEGVNSPLRSVSYLERWAGKSALFDEYTGYIVVLFSCDIKKLC